MLHFPHYPFMGKATVDEGEGKDNGDIDDDDADYDDDDQESIDP